MCGKHSTHHLNDLMPDDVTDRLTARRWIAKY